MRLERISKQYCEMLQKVCDQYNLYKEYVEIEVDNAENTIESLEGEVKKRDRRIESLKETLSIPRQHFNYIERLTEEEIEKHKNQILAEKAKEYGIPVDQVVSKMYYNTARKAAQKLVDEGLADSDTEQPHKSTAEQSRNNLQSKTLQASSSQATNVGRRFSNSMQREVSSKSILSK